MQAGLLRVSASLVNQPYGHVHARPFHTSTLQWFTSLSLATWGQLSACWLHDDCIPDILQCTILSAGYGIVAPLNFVCVLA